MNNRQIIQLSKFLSVLFAPYYAPLWVLMWTFFFCYWLSLSVYSVVQIFVMVLFTTVIIPNVIIDMFRVGNNWTHIQLAHREHRHLPYVIMVLGYGVCLSLLTMQNAPMCIRGVVLTALVSQLICVIVNAFWKISTHMVGMGGLVGALIAFSLEFHFNPVFMLCLLLIISGAVGTARMVLRQHSLSQIFVGFIVGYICALFFIMVSWF